MISRNFLFRNHVQFFNVSHFHLQPFPHCLKSECVLKRSNLFRSKWAMETPKYANTIWSLNHSLKMRMHEGFWNQVEHLRRKFKCTVRYGWVHESLQNFHKRGKRNFLLYFINFTQSEKTFDVLAGSSIKTYKLILAARQCCQL